MALGIVVRFCSTTKLEGLFSLVTGSMPSDCGYMLPSEKVEYGAIGGGAGWQSCSSPNSHVKIRWGQRKLHGVVLPGRQGENHA